ncbi:acyl-CoA carboxylase subunit epsilon [Longispora sp. NPDC051575]|uniref:acyl-CoA carboxylase subunit epsilon n=1 Tax=Longispora sp. NPDC051575 TaxID=3154943 RepID=UPI003421EAAC
MTGTEAGPGAGAGAPAVTVPAITVSGNPTPEELAALVAVLSSRPSAAEEPAPAGFTPWRASALPAPQRGWRSSALPR